MTDIRPAFRTVRSRMLTGHNLVYFAPGPWQGLWRNRHRLMSEFAQHNRVLYVEPPPYLRPVVRRLANLETWREMLEPRLSRVQDKLYVYHSPVFAPISGRFPLKAILSALRMALLRRVMRDLEISHPILWLSQPTMGDLVGQFGAPLTIYHVVDEYTAYEGVTEELAAQIRQQEAQVMARADLVIVVSQTLLEAKRSHNLHTHLVPNGVDIEAFNRIVAERAAPPADLAAIREPRLIYAGLIGSRLDLEMLIALAQRRPEWALVLIGQVDDRGCQDELAYLMSLPNVHFLGLKAAFAVPRYLLACEVCLLPYRRSQESHHIDPLKLYEGLAAGKPVVSTPIPSVLPYGDLVQLASDPNEFENAVQAALGERDKTMAAKRRAVAAANTWEARAQQISMLIESHLERVGV